MIPWWNIETYVSLFFYTMVWSSCDMVISTRFQSWTSWKRISIPVSLPCKVLVSVPTAAVYCLPLIRPQLFQPANNPARAAAAAGSKACRERERDLSPGSESYQLSIASQGHLGNCQPKMIKLKYGLIEFWIAAHREPGLDSRTCAVF